MASLRSAWILAAVGLTCLLACAHRRASPAEPACEPVPQALVADHTLCAVPRAVERLSGHPVRPDRDRVSIGTSSEAGSARVLRVESYRVYSIEHVFLTLDLETGTLVRDEHRTQDVPDRHEELVDLPEHAERRHAVLQEMLRTVEIVGRGGRADEHVNLPHPELRSVQEFLRRLIAR